VVNPDTARVMSLSNPLRKMSKSDPDADSRILLNDPPELIARKIRRAQTDSLGSVSGDAGALGKRPGVANLVRILQATSGGAVPSVDGLSMAALKQHVTDAVVARLQPIRGEMDRLLKDPQHLASVLKQGSCSARELAATNMRDIRAAVGLSDRE
jgi:tryptophanyl-tRNA synthetase